MEIEKIVVKGKIVSLKREYSNNGEINYNLRKIQAGLGLLKSIQKKKNNRIVLWLLIYCSNSISMRGIFIILQFGNETNGYKTRATGELRLHLRSATIMSRLGIAQEYLLLLGT